MFSFFCPEEVSWQAAQLWGACSASWRMSMVWVVTAEGELLYQHPDSSGQDFTLFNVLSGRKGSICADKEYLDV